MSCSNPRCTSCNSDKTSECPTAVDEAPYIAAFDDNCEEVVLQNYRGVVASDGDTAKFTDGSSERGHIYLNPPTERGVSWVSGYGTDGRLIKVTGEEGDVLQRRGADWVPRSIGVASLTTPSSVISPALLGVAPVWICGPNDTQVMGKISAEANSVGVINASGDYTFMPYADFFKIIAAQICDVIPAWNGSDCVGSLLGCSSSGVVRMAPVKGKSLSAIDNGSSACWGLKATSSEDGASLLIFKYTGSDQRFKVPPGAVAMRLKIWGSGSTLDGVGEAQMATSPAGGVGGFTKLKYPVTEGAEFSVMVGGTNFDNTPGFPTYGFGGNWSSDYHNHAGGGLSGVFQGTAAISPSDMSRAIAIAGGGGAPGRSSPAGANAVIGGPGNAPDAGTNPSMKGSDATPGQTSGGGGGGGGYQGGRHKALGGYGGTGYISTLGSEGSVEYSATGATLPPGTSEPEYISGTGTPRKSGLVVVQFLFE